MASEIPKVQVLNAITPSPESARSQILEYPNLAPRVGAYITDERTRQDSFWDAEDGSIEEKYAAEQLAMMYLLMGSLALKDAHDEASKERWSKRFTDASSELYGRPDRDTALALQERGIESILSQCERATAETRHYFVSTYGEALGKVNEELKKDDILTPEEVEKDLTAVFVYLPNDMTQVG